MYILATVYERKLFKYVREVKINRIILKYAIRHYKVLALTELRGHQGLVSGL